REGCWRKPPALVSRTLRSASHAAFRLDEEFRQGWRPTGRRNPSRKERRPGRNQRDRNFYPEVRGERHTAARSRRRAASRVKPAAASRWSLASDDEESHDAELPDQLA